MKVWVVETGCYENFGLSGVYSSLDVAKENHPITDSMLKQYPDAQWIQESDGSWSNNADWDHLTQIREVEVLSEPNRCEVGGCSQGGAFRNEGSLILTCDDHWRMTYRPSSQAI